MIVTSGDAEWEEEVVEGVEEGGTEGWAGRKREDGRGIEEDREVAVAEAVIGGGEGVRFSNTVELERQLWSRSKVPA